jgi:hypothetical protein
VTNSYYLGPDKGRWYPSTWDDLQEAVAGGLLDEGAWVELKKQLPPSNPEMNLELARDLASLALDGGLFVIGVAEDPKNKGNADQVVGVPTPMKDLDRLDQVARDRVHPPLFVSGREIPNPYAPGSGCLLVTIPASGSAPHMVDERYWGRGATGKRVLGDPEVRSLMQRRRVDDEALVRSLNALVEEDPVPESERSGAAHLYVLVRPTDARPDCLAHWIAGSTGDLTVRFQAEAKAAEGPWSRDVSPRLSECTRLKRTSAGVAMTTRVDLEESQLTCHIGEDGSVGLICGRGSDIVPPSVVTGSRVVLPMLILALARDSLALTARLAESQSSYQGEWQVGLRMDRMRGVLPVDLLYWPSGSRHPYTADEYLSIDTTTTLEMSEDPGSVVLRLTGRLLRSLGVESRYQAPSEGTE